MSVEIDPVEILSDRENHQKTTSLKTKTTHLPVSATLDTHPLTDSLPTPVPAPIVLPIQEPDQYYPVPSRPSQEVSANVKVSRRQPVVKKITGVDRKPYDYLGISILNTLFCCPLFGLFALFYSIQVNIKHSAGSILEANAYSQVAKKLNIIAVAVGTLFWIVFIIYPIFRGADHSANT